MGSKKLTMRFTTSAAVLACKRAHHQVAGGGGVDRGADGVGVAHFTDENHIGVVAQGAGNRVVEGVHVDAQISLDMTDFLLVCTNSNGILDGENVAGSGAVDPVDDGGHRGGLAAAGHAGDEEQAPVQAGQLLHGLARHVKIFEAGNHLGQISAACSGARRT
jgi:hypothetical protein